jgi:hypothetical protein
MIRLVVRSVVPFLLFGHPSSHQKRESQADFWSHPFSSRTPPSSSPLSSRIQPPPPHRLLTPATGSGRHHHHHADPALTTSSLDFLRLGAMEARSPPQTARKSSSTEATWSWRPRSDPPLLHSTPLSNLRVNLPCSDFRSLDADEMWGQPG